MGPGTEAYPNPGPAGPPAPDVARERCLRAEHLEDLVKAEQAQRREQARDLERCAAALAELGPRVEGWVAAGPSRYPRLVGLRLF